MNKEPMDKDSGDGGRGGQGKVMGKMRTTVTEQLIKNQYKK